MAEEVWLLALGRKTPTTAPTPAAREPAFRVPPGWTYVEPDQALASMRLGLI